MTASDKPEGQGGDIVTRLRLLERKGYGPSNFMSTCADAAAEIERLRLLSSPRVEEVRREALEEAAKVADEVADHEREEIAETKKELGNDYDPNSYGSGWSDGARTTAESIAEAIRALSLQVG